MVQLNNEGASPTDRRSVCLQNEDDVDRMDLDSAPGASTSMPSAVEDMHVGIELGNAPESINTPQPEPIGGPANQGDGEPHGPWAPAISRPDARARGWRRRVCILQSWCC